MAEGTFVTAPIQTAELQALNVPPPGGVGMNIISPFDAEAVAAAVTVADDYYFDIKNLHNNHRSFDNVHYEDLREAKRYKTGCQTATIIPALVNVLANENVNLAPVMGVLTEIQQDLVTIRQDITLIQQNQQNQQAFQVATQQALVNIEANVAQNHLETQQALAVLNIKVANASARDDDDVVDPPQIGAIAPGPEFPRTILDLRNLQPGQILTDIENYYRLDHLGRRNTRIRRVQRTYGVTI